MSYGARFTEDRTFGVEIECHPPEGMGQTQTAAAITQATGITVEWARYTHDVRNVWKIVTDASVPGGIELVSPPLAGEPGLRQIEIICGALGDLGFRVNRSCGLHVHHDVRDYRTKDFVKLAQLYVKMEGAIDLIMPPSRRANNSRLLRSVRMGAATVDHVQERMNYIKGATTPEEVMLRFHNGDRYHKLNMASYRRQGTIEFRQHSGTVEAEKIINWIKLTQNMVQLSYDATHWRAQGMDNLNLLMKFCPDKKVSAFYRARYKHFVTREREGR